MLCELFHTLEADAGLLFGQCVWGKFFLQWWYYRRGSRRGSINSCLSLGNQMPAVNVPRPPAALLSVVLIHLNDPCREASLFCDVTVVSVAIKLKKWRAL